jgi:hypothetical protein
MAMRNNANEALETREERRVQQVLYQGDISSFEGESYEDAGDGATPPHADHKEETV